MYTEELKLQKAKSRRSYKYCLYCGVNSLYWTKFGKIGCINCLHPFQDEYLNAFNENNQKLKSKFVDFQKLCIQLNNNKISYTIRYRVSRNPKNFIYPFRNKLTELSDKKIEFIQNVLLLKNYKNESTFYVSDGFYNFHDEDHIRYSIISNQYPKLIEKIKINSEIIKLNQKKLFDFLEDYGFVNSCPTNLGFGNKFSLKFSRKYIYLIPKSLHVNILSEKNSESIVIYLKNIITELFQQ